jgi:phosphonate transport system substrate-binding protein
MIRLKSICRGKEFYMVANRFNKRLVISVLFMSLIGLGGYAYGAERHITIAVLPCTDVVMTFKKFHPLVTYLKQQTGIDIRLVVPKGSERLETAIENGDIDIAFQDPHTYVRLASLYDKSTLVRSLNRAGAISQSGVVITSKDSLIKKVKDLKGKTVMFGPRVSATKWVAAKTLFEENGIDIDKDLKAYSNGGCCEDIAFNVYLKAVDAGVVCDHFLQEHPEKQREIGIDAMQLIVVSRTRLVPTKLFAARRGISESTVTKINDALLGLDKNKPEHAKILYRAELGGFQKSRDEDYNGIRMLIGAKKD